MTNLSDRELAKSDEVSGIEPAKQNRTQLADTIKASGQ
jgi:hypothetical protein